MVRLNLAAISSVKQKIYKAEDMLLFAICQTAGTLAP
jgi:hypothetical protein